MLQLLLHAEKIHVSVVNFRFHVMPCSMVWSGEAAEVQRLVDALALGGVDRKEFLTLHHRAVFRLYYQRSVNFKPLSRVRLHTCIFAPTCCLGQIHELPKVLQIQRSRHRLRRRGQRTQRPVCMRNTVCFQSRSHAARRRPKYAAGGSIKFTT